MKSLNTQIIAIANQKGGVGKTTTCANLGIGLAQAGKKVLLIDGDPQGSLTISLGHPQPDKLPFTLSDAMGRILMDEPLRPGEGIMHHPEGVDLMPANIQLSGMEVSLVNAMSRETILRQYLDTLKGQYSHILIAYLMEYSCLKTLASKHKTSLSKIIDKFNDGTGKWGVPYKTKLGNKRRYFANYADCKGKGSATDYISNAAIVYGYAVNTLENRLKAKVCELCGTTESDHYEVHHINKLKNLKGKERWEIAMIAKHRKTLVVCRDCHRSIIHKK